MQQMKSQEKKAADIEYIYPKDMEFFNHHGTQVVVYFAIVSYLCYMAMPEFGFKIEVEEVDHNEYKDDHSRMDHEL
jgi:hypothetical protein